MNSPGATGRTAVLTIRDAADKDLLAELAARRVRRADVLRTRRIALGLTMRAVEDKSGVDHGHLSRVERGLSTPSRRIEAALARAYGCKIAELYEPMPDGDAAGSDQAA